MKLHLPVKLRASLIAAVIAVSASVYNAYGATAYVDNDYIISDTPANVAGNVYNGETATVYEIAGMDGEGNPTSTLVAKYNDKWYLVSGNQLTDTEWTGTLNPDTGLPEGAEFAGEDKSEFIIKLAAGSDSDVVEFKGHTEITVDVVKLESSVKSPEAGVEGLTSMTAKDELVVGSNASKVSVALENINISAGATELLGGSSLSIDNSAAGTAANEIDLGKVSGAGSLAIAGGVYDDAGEEKKTAVELDGVELTGNLGLSSTDATITGDVSVNRLTLTGSTTTVDGSVSTRGNAVVDADSSLTAAGDIATNTNGTGSIVVEGTVTSTGGDVTLDQAQVSGSVSADAGDVILSNTDVTDGAIINAGGSLNLTNNTSIIDQPDDNSDIRVTVGGDLNVIGGDAGINGDDKTIISGVTASVGGDVNIQAGADQVVEIGSTTLDITGGGTFNLTGDGEISVADSAVKGANTVTVAEGKDVSNTTFTDVTGQVTVNGSIAGGSIAGADDDKIDGVEVSGATASITGTTITNNEGNVSVTGGATVTDSSIAGAADVTVGVDSAVSGTDITGVTGAITIDGSLSGRTDAEGNTINATVQGGTDLTVSGAVSDADFSDLTGQVTVTGSIAGGSIAGTDADKLDGIEVSGADASITGTTITGNEGDIIVDAGSFINSTIEGGEHLSISAADITGSDITGLTGDIKITGTAFAGTDEDKIELVTKGTSTTVGHDAVNGGSIIIDSSNLSNAIITSGKTPAAGETPSGDISITGSSIASSEISTAEGNVNVGGVLRVVNAGSTTYNDRGNTQKFVTSLTRLGVVAAEGSVAVLESVSVVERNNSSASAYTGDVKLKITAEDGTSYLSTNSQIFDGNSSINTFTFDSIEIDPTADYTFTFVDATDDTTEKKVGVSLIPDDIETSKIAEASHSVVVAAAASIYDSVIADSTITTGNGSLGVAGIKVTNSIITTGEGAVTVEDSKVSASTIMTGEGDVEVTGSDITASAIVTNAGALTITDSTIDITTIMTGEGDVEVTGSDITASTIKTNAGGLTLTDSTVASATVAGTDDEGNATEEYTKSILSATAASFITGSTVSGTDITISEGALDIVSSSITGDVNISALSVAVKDSTTIALDGGEAHDASIIAKGTGSEGNLWMGDADSLAGGQATIANANVQVSNTTSIYGGNTIDLTKVYAVAGEAKSASTLGTVNNLRDGADAAKLNIDDSIIGMTAIHANGGGDGADASRYFGTVDVKKGSDVAIEGDVLIQSMNVNAGNLYTDEDKLSSVKIGGDAYIKTLQIRGAGEAAGQSYIINDYKGTQVTIKGEAHVEALKFANEGVLSLIGDGTTHSTVASISPAANAEAHGIINVVKGTLTTPDLHISSYMSLGLNGGTVILGDVAAIGDALAASTTPVDAHVKLRDLTDAHQTGVAQLDARSTIKTSGLTRLTSAASHETGTSTAVEGAKAYMYKVNCGQGNTATVADGMKLYKQDAAGAWVALNAGDTLQDGELVAKFNYEFTTSALATGAVVNTGATVNEAFAGLSDAEDDFLAPLTSTLVSGGSLAAGDVVNVNGQDYVVATQGQLTLAVDASYMVGASATLGTVETKHDGIASLSVQRDFSANKTDITAYELATIAKYWKDGVEIAPDAYDVLADADKAGWMPEYVAVDGTGIITISGKLTGSDNALTADKDITVTGGIVASRNTLTSTKGSISTGSITGDTNTLTSAGSISTGAIDGEGNKLAANGNVTVTGAVAGENTITSDAGNISVTGAITSTGNGNKLTAEAGSITAASITGGTNTLEANGDVTVTGAVAGENTIKSETGNIQTGAITGTGNGNTLTAEAGSITAASITGGTNTLAANGNVTVTGAVAGDNTITSDAGNIQTGAITGTGNGNTLTAEAGSITAASITGGTNTLAANGNVTVTGAVAGENTITSDAGIISVTGAITGTGNGNKLTAEAGSITAASITGGTNTLEAYGDVTVTGAVAGENTITSDAGNIQTGAITGTGNGNTLTAEAGSITAASITGGTNTLDAYGDVKVTGAVAGENTITSTMGSIETGEITGTGNELSAMHDVTVNGAVAGDNTLTSTMGDITVAGDISGEGNALTTNQGGVITVEGKLSGTGHTLIGSGVELATDDAIVIGELAATDSTVKVNDTAASAGSISIGSITAADEVGEGNFITTPRGNVTIGTLEGANAKTSIEVGSQYSITVAGKAGQTDANTASNQSWTAGKLAITAEAGLSLTDSELHITGGVEGSSLTLNSSELTANAVDLEALTIAGTSSVTASKVEVEDLTIDGTKATLNTTDLTVEGELTLSNGAKLNGQNVSAEMLVLENSDLNVAELSNVEGLVLKGSTAKVTKGLTGLTGEVRAEALNGEASSLTTNAISTSAQVVADASTIKTEQGGISADNGVTATNGGSIISAQGITSTAAGVTAQAGGSITAQGAITAGTVVKADGGSIRTEGSITAGSMEIANGGSITAEDVTLNGALNAAGGKLTAASVSGATSAELNAASISGALSMSGDDADVTAANGSIIGSISGANDVKLTGDSKITGTLAATGTVNATGGFIGSITKAGDVTAAGTTIGSIADAKAVKLTGSEVTGSVAMDGKLTMIGGKADSVSGATGAELTDATITGALNATTGTIEAQGGSIGTITGAADKVELDGTAIGSIDMATAGTLIVKDTTTGAVNADADNTVANAELTNAIIGSGLNVTNNMTTTGDVTVLGDVKVGNDLAVNTGKLTADNVTVGGTTTLTGGTVDVAGKFHSTTIELKDIAGEMEQLLADAGLSMSGVSVKVTGTGADSVKVGEGMTLTNGADVTNFGGAQITGDLEVDGSSFTNAGAVAVTNGTITVKDNGTLTGTSLSADAVTVNNGSITGAVTADTGDVTVNTGSITGDVTAKGSVALGNGSIFGNVTANTGNVTATGSTISGDVAAADVKLTGSEVTGTVTMDGKLTMTNGKAASVSGATSAELNAASISGALSMSGDDADVTAANGSIIGSISGAADVKLTGSTAGNVAATGDVTLTAGSTAGNVTTEGDVTLAGSTAGDVTTTGDVKVSGSIAGDVIADGSVKLTDATVGAVDADAATLTHSTINGALTAGDTVVSSDVVVMGSADVDGLTVNKGSSLIASDVIADGVLDIQGAVTTTTGNVALTGAAGSSITADVTAAGDVIIAGTVAATEAALKGANVTIEGTLAAGKGVTLAGTVTGEGFIVKTGGDTLALAGDTKIGGVTVKGSTLEVDGGADLGKLNVSDKSTVEIAGKDMGTVKVAAGSSIKDSIVNVDLSLNARTRTAINGDVIDGSVDMDGTTVVLRGDIDETAVKDQDSYKLVTGTVKGDYTVEHELDTLNVHTEGGDIVFSKNYKGAAGKTENQAATADALAAMPAVTGELASVMDALTHTRNEADALAALDSLGGAGLAAAPKLIADETKEHLQTLRSTIQSVAAGLQRCYNAEGVRLSNVESTAVSAAVTGGSSTVKEDGNSEEYSRKSIGAMFAGAHAINDEWTFGAAISFTQADADCGATTIESQGVFVDVGVMQQRGRFSQMGSIGCAFFSMDTERTVGVNAPGHAFVGKAEGSTDAAALTVSYETSYAIWKTENYSVSSVIMGEALFAQIDNMEEEGLGNAGLRSSYDDIACFSFGVGGRYTYHFGEERNPGYIALEAMVVADTGDSTMKVNNAFIGGGNSFQLSSPEAGNYGLRLNAGVLLPLGDQWGLFGNATGEIRSEQTTVGGSMGIKCSF